MDNQKEISGNDFGNGRQPQVSEGDQKKEEDESQRDVGPLELAGWTILLVVQDGIGVKKIDEQGERNKIKQIKKEKFLAANFFHIDK